MTSCRNAGGDLSRAFLASLAVHSVLGFTSTLWSDVLYGVKRGPTSLQVELIANTREAAVVADLVAEGALLSEAEPVEETLPDAEPQDLADLTSSPVLVEDPLASDVVPLGRVPRRVREVATSPAPSSQTVEGNSDITQAASEPGAEAAPDYLLNPEPRYPEAARRRGIEGVVELEVLVLSDGGAGSVRVARSSGSALLDEAALVAVRAWRFRPAVRAGEPVDSTVIIPIRFHLDRR